MNCAGLPPAPRDGIGRNLLGNDRVGGNDASRCICPVQAAGLANPGIILDDDLWLLWIIDQVDRSLATDIVAQNTDDHVVS